MAFNHQLSLAYTLIGACTLLPLIPLLSAPIDFIEPTSQIYAAPSMRGSSEQFSNPASLSISMTPKSLPISTGTTAPIVGFALCGGILIALTLTVRAFKKIAYINSHAFLLKRYKSVRILVSEHISTPFSFWIPGKNIIVLPMALASKADMLRLAVAHELQHHRQRDTRWLYLIEFLKMVCFWNPGSYVLAREVSLLQEFACDESLVGHRGISSSAYCRCLLWVAEQTLGNHHPLVGTASMTGIPAGQILKRRISFMMTSRKETITKRSALKIGTFAIAAITLFSGVTVLANASVQDRRISMEDAKKMAAHSQITSEFPMIVNEEVLAQLNRYLGTPDGREFLRRSLERKKKYEPTQHAAIAKYNMPPEILALPVIESGYRNITQGSNPRHGAGIWMFIQSTARNFNLRVDDEVDERLNVVKETDAAMRYLAALNLRFKDWGLALLAYNAGEGFVQRAINETGSRDVWHLVRNRYENDPDYLAKVIAVALIMQNDTLLK